MDRNLYRVRATFANTGEWEPEYYIAPDHESVAILFFTLRNRDLDSEPEGDCELRIDLITPHREANP